MLTMPSSNFPYLLNDTINATTLADDSSSTTRMFYLNNHNHQTEKTLQNASSVANAASTERQHAGSPHATSSAIPLPNAADGIICRTQSQVRLSIEQAAFEQKSLLMFHRLVNGIRQNHHHQHQQQQHDCTTRRTTSRLQQQQHQNVLDEPSILAQVSPPSDEWSISGFSDQQQDATSMSTTFLRNNNNSSNNNSFRIDDEDDDQNDIFALDL